MVQTMSANKTMALTRNIGISRSGFDEKRYVKKILHDQEGHAWFAIFREPNILTNDEYH